MLVYMNFVKMCLGLKMPNYPFNIKQEQYAPCLTQKLKLKFDLLKHYLGQKTLISFRL